MAMSTPQRTVALPGLNANPLVLDNGKMSPPPLTAHSSRLSSGMVAFTLLLIAERHGHSKLALERKNGKPSSHQQMERSSSQEQSTVVFTSLRTAEQPGPNKQQPARTQMEHGASLRSVLMGKR